MATLKNDIKKFIEVLANTNAPKHAINPWSFEKQENEIRRNNLLHYFLALAEQQPDVILVGEAPGYRGTRRSGVPFSSEKIILSHPFFTANKKFAIENIDLPFAESSASIVWKVMDDLKFYPLIWASYPFHPHKPGNTETNRAPTPEELSIGRPLLTNLMSIFAITNVVAVGRAAEKTLNELNISASHIRHPSHGGANLFRNGLTKFFNEHSKTKKV